MATQQCSTAPAAHLWSRTCTTRAGLFARAHQARTASRGAAERSKQVTHPVPRTEIWITYSQHAGSPVQSTMKEHTTLFPLLPASHWKLYRRIKWTLLLYTTGSMRCKPYHRRHVWQGAMLGEAALSCGRWAEASGQLGLRRRFPHASFGGVLVALLLWALPLFLVVLLLPFRRICAQRPNGSSSECHGRTT